MQATALGNNAMSKYWVLTINGTHNYDALNNAVAWQYIIAGREYAPKTKKKHLQCFIVYNSRTRFSTVKRQFPTAHIERMMGTPIEASTYCKKDGDFKEFGELPDFTGGRSGGEAKRERYQSAIKLAKQGDFEEIEVKHPDMFWNSYHTMKRIAMDNPPKTKILKKLEHEWIWGPTGTGKSITARKENPNAYIKSHNKWWLGYQNEECVIIDDLSKTEATWFGEHLKQWCDYYPFPSETKGDGKPIRPKKIVVTSNYDIEELWGHDEHLCQALTRRFKERHFTVPYVFVPEEEESIEEDEPQQFTQAIVADLFAEHSAHSQEDMDEIAIIQPNELEPIEEEDENTIVID